MKRNLIYHTQITADETVYVSGKKTQEHPCHLDAISRDGVTLSCDMETLNDLLPNCSIIAPKQPVPLNLKFELGQSDKEIKSVSKVIYARRVSRDRYQLELRFDNLNEQEFELIDCFVEKGMRRNQMTPELLDVA